MADALIVAHIVHALDPELLRESAGRDVRSRRHLVGRRHSVIHHNDDALGVAHPYDVAPVGQHEIVVEEDDRIDLDGHDIARPHGLAAAFARENLLGDGHTHCFCACPAANRGQFA